MSKKNIFLIAVCNLSALILIMSWYFNICWNSSGFWFDVDSSVFEFFNKPLVPVSGYTMLVAVTNLRIFDMVSLAVMGLIFLHFFSKADSRGRHRLFCILIFLMMYAVAIKLLSSVMFHFNRPSPTRFFHGVNHVGSLVELPFKVKDQAGSCFPGDHGMMLLIFAMVMFRYCGLRAFLAGLLVIVVFSLPRIMGGAHWFSDVAVGAVSMALISGSWILLTPCSDCIVDFLQRHIPGNWKLFTGNYRFPV